MSVELERADGDVFDDVVGDLYPLDQLEVQRGRSEDGEPREAAERRDKETAQDELTDGAASGNPGNEGANEGRPGDPPGPIVEGPVLQVRLIRTPGGPS